MTRRSTYRRHDATPAEIAGVVIVGILCAAMIAGGILRGFGLI